VVGRPPGGSTGGVKPAGARSRECPMRHTLRALRAGDRYVRSAESVEDAEEAPRPRYAFELVLAAVLELDT
jgi:hypothetical protein